jgi:WD40 repeat protein
MELGWVETAMRNHGVRPEAFQRALARAGHLLDPLEPAHALVEVLLSQLATDEELRAVAEKLSAELPAAPRLTNLRVPAAHPAQRRVLYGHPFGQHVVIGPDSRTLLAYASDRKARMWDVASGQVLVLDQPIVEPGEFPSRWSSTPGRDEATWFRNPGDGAECAVLTGLGPVLGPAPRWLFTPDWEGSAVIWDMVGDAIQTIPLGRSRHRTLRAAAPDGIWLAVTSGDAGHVKLVDLATATTRVTLTGHTDHIGQIAISPDGTQVTTAGHDDTVRLWDAASGECLASMATPQGWYTAQVAFAPDGSWLAATGPDYTVWIWDLATSQRRAVLTGHRQEVTRIAVAPDGGWLVTCSRDKTARIWDTATGRLRSVLTGHTDFVTDAAIAPDGTWLVTCGHDRTIRVWDPDPAYDRPERRSEVKGLAGPLLAVEDMTEEGASWIEDVTSGEVRHRFTDRAQMRRLAAVASDGTWLVLQGYRGILIIFDTDTGRVRAELSGHTKQVTGAAIAPDGTWLASWAEDRTVRLWDPVTGECTATLTAGKAAVHQVAIAPDGTWLAMACSDQVVRIKDAATGKNRKLLKGHTKAVRAVAIAPDGTWLASGAADATVRIWDAATGAQQVCLTDHTAPATAVAISPDGAWLASTSNEAILRVWHMPTATLATAMRVDASRLDRCQWLPDGSGICVTGDTRPYVFAFSP